MMENRKNRKGFTIAELLIVVAIIGVLVAISVPIFTSQLKKARIATNQANARIAKSVALAEYQSNPDLDGDYVMYFYDTKTGRLAPMTEEPGEKSSFVYKKGDDINLWHYDDNRNIGVQYNSIKGGDLTNLSEKNKKDLGNKIADGWYVKIALCDRTVKGKKYKKGEIMFLAFEIIGG